jgi:hypothetical protein
MGSRGHPKGTERYSPSIGPLANPSAARLVIRFGAKTFGSPCYGFPRYHWKSTSSAARL